MVLDRAMQILAVLEVRPRSLAELVEATGLPRATAHRTAVALEAHGLVRRDADGRFGLGLRLVELGAAAAAGASLAEAARPALEGLRDSTGESVQLYVRQGDVRVCVVSLESPHSLRTIVPVGASLPMTLGSAAKALMDGSSKWFESVEEREKGVASASAPVHLGGRVVAAVSVSGPVERTSRSPGKRYGAAVRRAAAAVERALA